MGIRFINGAKTAIADLVKSYEVTNKTTGEISTLGYIPWPVALALANRPTQAVRYWNDLPYFELFGGVVVGVTQSLTLSKGATVGAEVESDLRQDTFLPVLDGRNLPIPASRVDSRDISDTINRCRAKSVAMVSGVGLCLYSGGLTNNVTFFHKLAVSPDSDLDMVKPLLATKPGKANYIDWPTALAAVRITDETFTWSIGWHLVKDPKTGEVLHIPALRVGTGWAVTVTVTYRGISHTEMLPIMGPLLVNTTRGEKVLDHQPLVTPNVHDWNRAVMRCLVKSIALRTGYGISVYANEDIAALHVEPIQRTPGATVPAPASVTSEKTPATLVALEELIKQAEALALHTGTEIRPFLDWLEQTEAKSFSDLPAEILVRGITAMVQMPAASQGSTVPH